MWDVSPTMSSKASLETRHSPSPGPARRHFTMSGKPELASVSLSLDPGLAGGTLGGHYYTGCVGSLNQYEIASFMRVVSCHRLHFYVRTLLRPVSQAADVSSFASKSWTDIIRTRLETCWPHIRSLPLWQAPSLTAHSRQGKKLESVGISNYLKQIFIVTTKVFILPSSRHQPPPPQQLWLSSSVRGSGNVIPAQRKRPFSAIKSVI